MSRSRMKYGVQTSHKVAVLFKLPNPRAYRITTFGNLSGHFKARRVLATHIAGTRIFTRSRYKIRTYDRLACFVFKEAICNFLQANMGVRVCECSMRVVLPLNIIRLAREWCVVNSHMA